MSFRWCLPEDRKTEEKFLFALASRISLKKAGVARNQTSFEKYVLPLFEEKQLHASAADNAIAFALLGEILHPAAGSGRFLPQHCPHWLAFRRLFLALCDEEIPKELLTELGGSAWDEMSDLEKAELAVALGLYELGTDSSNAVSRLPPIFDSVSLEEDYAKRLPAIREIVVTRLDSYAAVSLAGAKASLLETGRIDLNTDCGALYEISQNLAWDYLPASIDLPRSGDTPTTLSLLADVVKEAGIDLNIEAEYREAARSLRTVFFDIATEMTVGKVVDPEIEAWELEEMFCERRVVEDPFTVISDARIQFFLAEGMATKGGGFLRRIASMFDTAEDKGARVRINPVKTMLAVHWLNPEFPLWLMTFPAVECFLRILGIDNDGYPLNEKIREYTKTRKESPGSPLVTASKQLITGLEFASPPSSCEGMEFRKYLANAPSFPALQQHVRGLPILDLGPIREK